ncbi:MULTISPECIES: hypothetical protein [Azospirillum]|uniref:DUF2946 domain-containing protein n=1 Tax=Azospirillum brasilense TaxID=192 RepID=A0A6L3B251_AZOBR|nr:hypothetical protein [Azospirillum brasilense]KAA0686149.1 hypothetical protein DS837_10640 [Azospirillum brasilense]
MWIMQALRRILSVVMVLVLVTGTTAQAAMLMPMEGMAGDAAVSTSMDMELADAPDCPDCDGMDQSTMDMSFCHSACITGAMLLPQVPVPLPMITSSTTLAPLTPWQGQSLPPEPFPPKSTLRI